MVNSGSKIIVRILVLPGHGKCCHEPAINLLSKYKDNIKISILDQYVPEHKALDDYVLKSSPSIEQLANIKDLVHQYRLNDIEADRGIFSK